MEELYVYGVKFMANEKMLVSLALMKTVWEQQQKDHIDMLMPFVLYSISELKENAIISIAETKSKVCSSFGITIYSNVMETLFRRMSSTQGVRYIRKEGQVFYRTAQEINLDLFKQKQNIYTKIQQEVVDSFLHFLQMQTESIDTEVATNELIAYLCKYGYNLHEDDTVDLNNETSIWTKRIGEFIQTIAKENSVLFGYLKDIAKGGMLSKVYFNTSDVTHNMKRSKKFHNTKIYFDTPLLMYVLGYSGHALQESVEELLSLLLHNGATVHAFEHNLDELGSILEAYVSRYRKGTLDTSYNFDYLIENDVAPEKIENDIPSLRYVLREKNIFIEDTPVYDDYWKNIGHQQFDDYLSQHMRYKKDNRRDNDVASIAAIYRLRAQDYYKYYETCVALFVATNNSLVRHTIEYFKNHEGKKGIPAIVDDTFLTSLLWIKYTPNNESIPRLKLIVDALAAQEPSENFWIKFYERIDELYARREITEEEVIELKYTHFSRKNVFDISEGDVNKITPETVREIQRINFRQQHKEVIAEKDKALEEKSVAEKERDENKRQLEVAQAQIVAERALPYLQKILKFEKYSNILSLSLITIVVYIVVSYITRMLNWVTSYAIIINAGITGAFVAIVPKFFDKLISQQNNNLRNKIVEKYKNWVYNKISTKYVGDASRITTYIDEQLEKSKRK